MDYNNTDIIIARATPIGKSALAIIRMSGVGLMDIIQKMWPNSIFQPNHIVLKKIKLSHSKVVLDSCMIAYYQQPKSFTGEDMMEIFCHGNDINVENIINEFIKKGVRLAYPGEFSYRAFKNGKIDLLQAESIAAKINQNSNQYGVALQNLESGETSTKITKLRKKVVNIQSIIEHELDFNEEEINHITVEEIKKQLTIIMRGIKEVLTVSLYLQRLEKGYKVVLLGVPNAGKSTLFNRIVGIDKAIVTEVKGTTRDTLESHIQIKGIPFIFYDTAGYRNTSDQIETIGVEKTIEITKRSDVVFVLDDLNPKKSFVRLSEQIPFLKEKECILIKTKCDDLKNINKKNIIEISCKKNLGIDLLLTTLLTSIRVGIEKEDSNNIALCNMRQINLLERVHEVLQEVLKNVNANIEMDIVASQLRTGIDLFEELLGKITSNEILNNIFKGFCVGK
tara:strand:- start:1013 stop:2365 length:1353 start_codon:yes stop_codon:yes gene_type:complete